MKVLNKELILRVKDSTHSTGKLLLNDSGVIFFGSDQQHRDIKVQGISYEDDYKGNAIAGTFHQGRIDLRFHQSFPDARVLGIFQKLLSDPDLSFLNTWETYYQGRRLL